MAEKAWRVDAKGATISVNVDQKKSILLSETAVSVQDRLLFWR